MRQVKVISPCWAVLGDTGFLAVVFSVALGRICRHRIRIRIRIHFIALRNPGFLCRTVWYLRWHTGCGRAERRHAHTNMYTGSLEHAYTHTHTNTHTQSTGYETCARTHTHTHTHKHTHTQALSLSLTHTQTHTNMHTRTQVHWDRMCKSTWPPHLVTEYWHWANQFQYCPHKGPCRVATRTTLLWINGMTVNGMTQPMSKPWVSPLEAGSFTITPIRQNNHSLCYVHHTCYQINCHCTFPWQSDHQKRHKKADWYNR